MSNSRMDEELESLRALVEDQRRRLENLEGRSWPGLDNGNDRHSRRDLLRIAGAGLAGAAGAVALNVIPAAAATGGNFILGNVNEADSQSVLRLTADKPPGAIFNNFYAFQADATNGGASGRAAVSNGLEGVGLNTGAGLAAVSAAGPGAILGSQTGPDLQLGGAFVNKQAAGSGRLAQMNRTEVGSAGPNYTAGANFPELVRGTDASLWLSTKGTSTTTTANWRRVNSVRVDKADGSGGFFQPVRIIDTRNGTGGVAGQRAANSATTWGPFPGTNGLPADALGFVGNVTVTGYTGNGFLAVYPAGASFDPASSPSTMNYSTNWAWANGFTVGFGTGTTNGGKITIYTGLIPTHVIVDAMAYFH